MAEIEVNVEGSGPVRVAAGATLLDVAAAAKVEDALVARRGDLLVDLASPARKGETVAFLSYED